MQKQVFFVSMKNVFSSCCAIVFILETEAMLLCVRTSVAHETLSLISCYTLYLSFIGVVPPEEAPNAKEDLWTAYWMHG